jgi:vacuolar protein sorting-associated protein 13A/C
LQLLVTDLGSDFSFVSREQALALQEPVTWATEYNNNILLPENRYQIVDIFRSQNAAQAKRIYIENLVLHPIKVTLTFQQTALPRKKDETAMAGYVEYLSYIPTFANVDRATLKLNSFIVSDAMESVQSLTSRITANSWRDLNYQLAKLAGSLTALGRPVGLARNIGGGVQAFFYEPYQGAMTSPSCFVMGIGKGASSLVGGVASGLLNSTAAIVSTASQGLSQGIVTMSGDEKYVLKRTDKRRKAQEAAREGVFSGLREGGGSFLSGVTAGLTGVITNP